MQTRNRLLDDLARVATGALGVAGGLRHEAEARLRRQFERILADMDLVTREEFELVRALAVKAREEQEELKDRVAALETQSAAAGKAEAPRKTRARKPAGRAKAAKPTKPAS